MKKTKNIYWVITVFFAAFMIFSSVSNVTMSQEAVAFMKQLGYPKYFIPFIGVAKLLGCVAILIPGYYRVKEWAYAGLFFDLASATYSLIAVFGINSGLLFMALAIGLGAISYAFYHKVYGPGRKQRRGLQNIKGNKTSIALYSIKTPVYLIKYGLTAFSQIS